MALMLLWVFSSSCGEVVKGWRKKLSTQEIECFEIYVAKNKKAFLPRDRAEIGTEESPLPKPRPSSAPLLPKVHHNWDLFPQMRSECVPRKVFTFKELL